MPKRYHFQRGSASLRGAASWSTQRCHGSTGAMAQQTTHAPRDREGTARYADALIREVIAACPRRLAGSDSERRAQERLADEMRDAGLAVELAPFRFSTNLYAVLALHFGLATAATAALLAGAPWLALALHSLAGLSYLLDSTRRAYVLRRLLPFRTSHNLIGVRPAAAAEPRLRVVLVGHSDAAYTGLVFHPELVRRATAEPPLRALRFLRKGLLVATGSVLLLALLDAAAALGLARGGWLAWSAIALTVPSALSFLLNLEVVLRDRVVPGANDNLSGCVGGLVVARRLRDLAPEDVELVFVATGAEEAGTGGAWALARQRRAAWDPGRTLVVGTDGLTNGELRYFAEGEIVPIPVPAKLEAAVLRVAERDPRWSSIARFDIPTGGTDALPFAVMGYEALTVGCVDPGIGAPRHYHRAQDDPEHLDLEQLVDSIDFVETLVRELVATR